MIELGKHIEILLLSNDCVIVPEFGGFVAHHVCAHYDESDHSYLPPRRMLGFNAQLRINDSLLVQSYITAYDISYPEALRHIQDEVDELKHQLDNEGSYTLENIGTLTLNAEGNYQFEPCEAGILSPELYGLGNCQMLTLKDRLANPQDTNVAADTPRAADEPTAAEDTEADESPALLAFTESEEEHQERAVAIKMSWIRNTVAIAAAIAAFFIMATPIANSNLNTRTMSQLHSKLLYRLIPQDTNIVPATPVANTQKTAIAQPASDSTAMKAQPTTTAAQPADDKVATTADDKAATTAVKAATRTASHPYCIVLASQVKRSNAEAYVEQLRKQGYSEAQLYINNGIVRVVYGSYATEAEAYRQLNSMNDKEEFSEAWVYKRVES